jgi:hypothetical protein
MSDANATVANGKPRRKSLSDQLDRLDGVIDDLSDGLNQAVSHAVERGVNTAVQSVIQAVLTNPELVRQFGLTMPASSSVDRKVKETGRKQGFLGDVLDRAADGLSRVGGVVVPDAPVLRPLRLVTGAGVLAAAGVGAWLAAPYLAVGSGWLSGRVALLSGRLLALCG